MLQAILVLLWRSALYAPVIVSPQKSRKHAFTIGDFLTTVLISSHTACYGILFRISIRLTRRYVMHAYLIES